MVRSSRLIVASAFGLMGAIGTATWLAAADAKPAAPAAPTAAPAGDPISAGLTQAKVTHAETLATAKADLVKAIDARISSATQAGDLKLVTGLNAARATADSNGSIPPDVKDAAVVGAKIHYDAVVKTANQTLSNAYQSAIREYTKAGKIELAQGVQAEFEAAQAQLGAPAGVAARPQSEPVTHFGKLLPPMWEASGTYGALPGGGIEPAKGTHLMSKPADFLSPTRDWTFDLWFVVKKKDEMGVVGIGDGRFDGSIALAIRAPADQKHGVNICNGDEWGRRVADIKEPGEYMVRIEKTGPALTFSVGVEKDGNFDVIGTRTINDPKDFMSKLSERSAHLYFGGAIVFKQYRLNFRAPGAAPAATAAKPADPAPAPKKKKK
jgi:hypothetical protein